MKYKIGDILKRNYKTHIETWKVIEYNDIILYLHPICVPYNNYMSFNLNGKDVYPFSPTSDFIKFKNKCNLPEWL